MTKRESERLTKVEEHLKATNAKLDYLIERFDDYVRNDEKKFITRLEGKVAVSTFTMLIGVLGLWISIKP